MIRACGACGTRNRIPAKHLADRGRCGSCKADLDPVASPLEVDTRQFRDIARNARVPILVDFWAPWCGPCKMASPHVARVAEESAGNALVLKVNTDQNPELATEYKIRGIPNFVVLVDGKVHSQHAGVADHRALRSWLGV